MKYLSILSICLLFMSCGASHLENADVREQLFSETGLLNKVNQGDSWEDVKLLAGDYWEVNEDQSNNIYQLLKEGTSDNERMCVSFILSDKKVAGIGLYLASSKIGSTALRLYELDLFEQYKRKFGIDFEKEKNANTTYEGVNLGYSYSSLLDNGSPSITVHCSSY